MTRNCLHPSAGIIKSGTAGKKQIRFQFPGRNEEHVAGCSVSVKKKKSACDVGMQTLFSGDEGIRTPVPG